MIKLRIENGNLSKRQQQYQRADNIRKPQMGINKWMY